MNLFINGSSLGVLSDIGPGTIGVFYSNDSGLESCGGSVSFENSSPSFILSAHADDTSTPEKDGFALGESLVWKFEDLSGNQFDILNSSAFNSFTIGFVSISSLSYSSVVCEEETFGCIDPNYLEFNFNANIDDGSCINLVIEGCTNENSSNYNSEANIDDGSCIVLVSGCTDVNAFNFNSEAIIDDGNCIFAVSGCTDILATNYNSLANLDDGSCITDYEEIDCILPVFNYTNTGSNMSIILTPDFFNDFPVLASDAFIIALSASNVTVGFTYVFSDSLQNGQSQIALWGDDATTDELDGLLEGESASLQLVNGLDLFDISSDDIIYTTNGFLPLNNSTLTFNCTSEEVIENLFGCMDSSSLNYNPLATSDDGSCLYNEDLDFVANENTGSNATVLVLPQIESLIIDGVTLGEGDLIGLFYSTNEGYICSEFAEWSPNSTYSLAAWGDDALTINQDGFLVGQNYYWAIQFLETGYSFFISAQYQSEGMDSFINNEVSVVTSFSAISYDNIYGCTDSLFVEFNPMASIDDSSCTILKVEGCTDLLFLEYWNYDSILFTIESLEIIPNFDNGTCQTILSQGCLDSNYTNYCSICNVSDPSDCGDVLVPGCTNEIAFNFDSIANLDDGSCELPSCVDYNVTSFAIEYSFYLNQIVFTYQLVNTTNEVLFDPIFDIEFYDSSYFILSDSMYSDNHVIYPGDTVSVQAIVTNDISDLPSFVLLSGQISLIGNNGISDSTPFLCEYVFAETYLNISNLGCTNPFAINYDSLATIDNGSCLNFITANISLIEPDCQGDFGSAIIYLSGGEPPYNSITLYDSYSQIGLPPENYTINFNSQGVAYLDGLLVGDYNVQVSDNNIIDTMFLFSISPPSSMSVVAYVQPNGVLSSTVFSENPIVYQWLFNGESVIGATQENYSPIAIGQYQVYIEDEFGCGSYSDIVVATISFLDLHEDPINQFSVFPNPTNGIINLKFPQLNNIYDIILTNIFGEELHKYSYYQDNTNVRLDVSYLPSGVYFISTEFNGHRTVKRFTKQNDY